MEAMVRPSMSGRRTHGLRVWEGFSSSSSNNEPEEEITVWGQKASERVKRRTYIRTLCQARTPAVWEAVSIKHCRRLPLTSSSTPFETLRVRRRYKRHTPTSVKHIFKSVNESTQSTGRSSRRLRERKPAEHGSSRVTHRRSTHTVPQPFREQRKLRVQVKHTRYHHRRALTGC